MKTLPRYQWQPTTAEIAAAAGISPEMVERFDHNTSPIASIWAPDIAAAQAAALNEYPAASYFDIRGAVAARTGLGPENVVPGAGADELILLVARAFLDAGDTAVSLTPTYPLYRIATAQAGARLVEVPARGPDFEFPAADFTAAISDAGLAWVCIPNNPTGSRPGDQTLAGILERARLVVLDAAYAEFSGDDWSQWIPRYPNLVVLHTMSKAYGLAGARVGYALAAAEIIAAIDGIRPPGSIGSLSVDLAVAALGAPERMQAAVSELSAAREALRPDLEDLGFRVLPSTVNFLLCEVGSRAHELQDRLLREGLVVRKFPADGPLVNYLRFTVRTPQAHARLVDALERNLS